MGAFITLVSSVINLLQLLVLVWCLLSWFPNIRWYDQPFKTLDMIVQPIVGPFRKIIPAIGNIDISPMVAMLVLQAVSYAIRSIPI